MQMFEDTNIWVNVGIGNEVTDVQIGSKDDLEKRDPQTINYKMVDKTKVDFEVSSFVMTNNAFLPVKRIYSMNKYKRISTVP